MDQEQLRQYNEQQRAKAKKLVLYSHILGWGGLGLLIAGSITMGILVGGTGALVTAGLGALCAVTGAVLGQVGRAMQGRVM
jgi:hypothetical protein